MEVYNQSETEFVCNFIGDINRIDPRMVENSRLNDVVQPGNIAYIRNEKVSLQPLQGIDTVQLKGKIADREFYGLYSKYVLEIAGGGRLKTIEIESRLVHHEVGDDVDIYLPTRDILQYPMREGEA